MPIGFMNPRNMCRSYKCYLKCGFSSAMGTSSDVRKEYESCPDLVGDFDISNLQQDNPDIAKIIETYVR